MRESVRNYIENLEEHVKVAGGYIAMMDEKKFKSLGDRNAIKYWKAYKAGIERAIYLAEIHLDVEK